MTREIRHFVKSLVTKLFPATNEIHCTREENHVLVFSNNGIFKTQSAVDWRREKG